MRKAPLVLLMALLALALAACGAHTATPIVGNSAAEATALPSTPTALPTTTPSPTAVPSPTVTLTPAATSTPTQTPTFTPMPISWWKPTPRTTWQIQTNGGNIDLHYKAQAYDVDLFDTPVKTIAALHKLGRKVICYFSAGTYEDWRPDVGKFPASVVGKPLEDWEGERYLDIRKIDALAPIMRARMDLAVKKGCDAVDPDNVQNYLEDTGFHITDADQLRYNKWLAAEAHRRGLAVGLKNDRPQIPQLVDDFDFSVSEECFTYNECEPLKQFIAANKAVFEIEYEALPAQVCPKANEWGFSLLIKPWDLSPWRYSCLRDWKE